MRCEKKERIIANNTIFNGGRKGYVRFSVQDYFINYGTRLRPQHKAGPAGHWWKPSHSEGRL